MVEECLFCRIIAGKVPGDVVYEDDEVVVLRDIRPQAPTHLLVMPREHIPTVAGLTPDRAGLVGHLVHVANQMAAREGIAERGYRLAVNCGAEGGQVIPHLHFHLLGGRQLSGLMG
ncbi:MAG: histidine triad nucleotide-binding protein [Chloroflexi bacterium]|nr:MAG: histidine triad nucleotide-binding protein [Chloroflexota bacterium]RLC97425.1 MAG: histidine triad nucleotide-binding protein [Chloroflexota bacterium]